MNGFTELEEKIAAGQPLLRSEAERVAASPDLPVVGMLGEMARKALHGDRVTYGRVQQIAPGDGARDREDAGEIRLTGVPASADEACARVREAVRQASGVPVTGFSLSDLLRMADDNLKGLADLARRLKDEGLSAVAEVPIDELHDRPDAADVIRAVTGSGLGAWRATVTRAPFAGRLDVMELAVSLQRETRAFKAFAPLPRIDPGDQPSTGYDDVRTIALARLTCRDIPSIQVDWPLYGPKLAQVAITYGADDIDGVSPLGPGALGARRAPREEIERHIRMAFAEPAERDGRYEMRV